MKAFFTRPSLCAVFTLVSVIATGGLFAQVRDIGTGTNPAATKPDHPDLLGNGDSADSVVIVGSLDEKRNAIVPNLGATSYGVTQNQIANQSQGSDASFNQTLLRVPGFAQDSYGQLHVRGEHANLQYRINDVLLPEGIAGFGQELDTRFVDGLQVITGSLPAQYGLRTAGIVDIHTKSGAFNNGDEVGFYGGSYNTFLMGAGYAMASPISASCRCITHLTWVSSRRFTCPGLDKRMRGLTWSICSIGCTNCATDRASAWERRSSGNGGGYTAASAWSSARSRSRQRRRTAGRLSRVSDVLSRRIRTEQIT